MGKTKKQPRRKTPPKRRQVKQHVPTVEDYVRKLPKERLIEIVLEQVRDNEYQIEMSSSDFEPHYSISECIGCVMQALLKADRPKPDKIVYAVRLVIEDDYCACEKAEEVLNRRWARRDWKQAAEMLRKLTSEYPVGKYARKNLDRWIAAAEEKSG